MKKLISWLLLCATAALPLSAQYFFSFELTSVPYQKDRRVMSGDELWGTVSVKSIATQETRELSVRNFLRQDEVFTEAFTAVDEYKGILVLSIATVEIRADGGKTYAENRFLIIDPKAGTKRVVQLPDGLRFMYPVSADELLVATIDDSQKKWNPFYKEDMTYYNLGRLYCYNVDTAESELLFDNAQWQIDFDQNLCDSQFIYDKDARQILIIEELESKFDETPSKPQRLRLFDVDARTFTELDSVRDPNKYDAGYFEIGSFAGGKIVYQKRAGSRVEIIYKDLATGKTDFDEYRVLNAIGTDKILAAVKHKTSLKERMSDKDTFFCTRYDLKIISKNADGKTAVLDTHTVLVDERGDFSTFRNAYAHRTRCVDIYIDEVNAALFAAPAVMPGAQVTERQ